MDYPDDRNAPWYDDDTEDDFPGEDPAERAAIEARDRQPAPAPTES